MSTETIEAISRKHGIEIKWDYSKAGQTVIIPVKRRPRPQDEKEEQDKENEDKPNINQGT